MTTLSHAFENRDKEKEKGLWFFQHTHHVLADNFHAHMVKQRDANLVHIEKSLSGIIFKH